MDGSKSSDNSEIKSYIWDFDVSDGLGEDASGAIVDASSLKKDGLITVTAIVEQFPEIELLDDDKDGIYENSYQGFTQSGEYKIIVSAQNSEGGRAELVQTTVYVLSRWDVNGDGVVDISDLVMVGRHFGERTSEGDVNGDGLVDISDLLAVGYHLGEKYK